MDDEGNEHYVLEPESVLIQFIGVILNSSQNTLVHL